VKLPDWLYGLMLWIQQQPQMRQFYLVLFGILVLAILWTVVVHVLTAIGVLHPAN